MYIYIYRYIYSILRRIMWYACVYIYVYTSVRERERERDSVELSRERASGTLELNISVRELRGCGVLNEPE